MTDLPGRHCRCRRRRPTNTKASSTNAEAQEVIYIEGEFEEAEETKAEDKNNEVLSEASRINNNINIKRINILILLCHDILLLLY